MQFFVCLKNPADPPREVPLLTGVSGFTLLIVEIPIRATVSNQGRWAVPLKTPLWDLKLRYLFVVVYLGGIILVKRSKVFFEHCSSALHSLSFLLCPWWREKSFVPQFPEHLSIFLFFPMDFPLQFVSLLHFGSFPGWNECHWPESHLCQFSLATY